MGTPNESSTAVVLNAKKALWEKRTGASCDDDGTCSMCSEECGPRASVPWNRDQGYAMKAKGDAKESQSQELWDANTIACKAIQIKYFQGVRSNLREYSA